MIATLAPECQDASDVLLCEADYLFCVTIHLQSCGRGEEALTLLRAGLDLALRGRLLVATGKRTCVCPTAKVAQVLRTIGVHDKKLHRAVCKVMDGEIVKQTEQRQVLKAFSRETVGEAPDPRKPRHFDEAYQLYRGVTLPAPQCRRVPK